MTETIGFAVYNQPVESYFDYAEEHGIGHFEIHPILEHSQIHTFTSKRIQSLLSFSERTGIRYSVHAPCALDLSERIPFFRKSNITVLKKILTIAHEIHATHVTCHLGDFHGFVAWPWLRTKLLKRVVQSLEELLEHCQNLQVTIAVENAIALHKGGELHNLGDCYRDFSFLFSHLDSPYLKFCLDCGHAHTNDGVLDYIHNVGQYICCVHFHDNRGIHDEHLGIGEGTIDWRNVLSALQAIPFYGPYVSECFQVKPHLAIQSLRSYAKMAE